MVSGNISKMLLTQYIIQFNIQLTYLDSICGYTGTFFSTYIDSKMPMVAIRDQVVLCYLVIETTVKCTHVIVTCTKMGNSF